MSETKKLTRADQAIAYHDRGFNCAQSVACAFSDKTGIDEKTLFRFTEGLGLGMGGMEGTCGAISAAAVLAGLKCSTCRTEHPDSKAVSYKCSRACLDAFKEMNGSVVCRELKGVDTGRVLRPCPDCIRDAVHIIEEHLYPEEP
ncbi:MAG: C-GCAxxG-C-C family protein [Enterocloster sp.]